MRMVGCPFAVRHSGVPERDPGAQTRPQTLQELRRQRDLRGQDDRPPTQHPHGFDRVDVHLGLARPGHPMYEERLLPAPQRGADFGDRGRLLRVEVRPRCTHTICPGIQLKTFPPFECHEPRVGHPSQGRQDWRWLGRRKQEDEEEDIQKERVLKIEYVRNK